MRSISWAAVVVVTFAGGATGHEPSLLPTTATWDLDALKKEPLRLKKTEYDKDKMQAKWLIELTRDLTDEERSVWKETAKSNKVYVTFVFKDKDGVVLKRVRGLREGEFVDKSGEKFRVVLELPKDVWVGTKTVEAVQK